MDWLKTIVKQNGWNFSEYVATPVLLDGENFLDNPCIPLAGITLDLTHLNKFNTVGCHFLDYVVSFID